MLNSLSWLKPLSKFVLEINPMICAAAIGAYVLGSVIAQSSAPKPLTVELDPFELSGEEITTLVKGAHTPTPTQSAKIEVEAKPSDAAQMAPAATARSEEPRKAEPKKRVVSQERKPSAKPATAQKPNPRPVETAALATPQLPPPPPVAITPDAAQEKRSWLGRTWNTVSGWSGDAADAVVATPGAIARAGKRTFEVVTDAVVPGR